VLVASFFNIPLLCLKFSMKLACAVTSVCLGLVILPLIIILTMHNIPLFSDACVLARLMELVIHPLLLSDS